MRPAFFSIKYPVVRLGALPVDPQWLGFLVDGLPMAETFAVEPQMEPYSMNTHSTFTKIRFIGICNDIRAHVASSPIAWQRRPFPLPLQFLSQGQPTESAKLGHAVAFQAFSELPGL